MRDSSRPLMDDMIASIYPGLKNTALGITGDPDKAEEAVLNAMEKLWEYWDRVPKDPRSLLLYARAMVKNECLKLLKQESRMQAQLILDDPDYIEKPGSGSFDEVADTVEAQLIIREIVALMKGLPDTDLLIAQFYFVQDQSTNEIARITGMKHSTVRTKIRRIRSFD